MLLSLDDYVRVTQETGEDIVGRYDGKNYTFPHGKPVDVHKTVAVHIFGFGLPDQSDSPHVQDKTVALTRLNWLRQSSDVEAALAKLGAPTLLRERALTIWSPTRPARTRTCWRWSRSAGWRSNWRRSKSWSAS